MKFKLITKLVALLMLASCTQANTQSIDAEQLLELIKQQQVPLIVDVRSAQEFNAGHIEGAINISYDQLNRRGSELNSYKDKQIILYCRSGARAKAAYQTLTSQGFNKLTDLSGHMIRWNQLHYPVVH